MSWIERQKATRRARTVPEVERIIALPEVPRISAEEAERLSYQNVQAAAYEGKCDCLTCQGRPFRLLEDQAGGLNAFLRDMRGFFSIKVGGGKTGLSMLMAHHAHATRPNGKILVLIPTGTYHQFWERDLAWARRHLAILGVPWIGLKQPKQKRRTLARSGRPGAYVLPYSMMSTSDTQELLTEISPWLIICDEGQELKGTGDSAKTRRFWKYVDQKKPRGVVMSGTLTTRTPLEYHRLIRWCLGDHSPLPYSVNEARVWASCVESGAQDLHHDGEAVLARKLKSIAPLCEWASQSLSTPLSYYKVEDLRKAYQHRLHTVPGFHSSSGKALGVSLEICNISAGEPNEQTRKLMHQVENDWLNPEGEVVQYGIEMHALLSELSAGIYNRRFWDERHPLVELGKEHHEAGQEYHRALRDFLKATKYPREGLDTPALVGLHHFHHGEIAGEEELFELWQQWKDLENQLLDRCVELDCQPPERQSEPVRVDDFKIRHAVEWAKRHAKPGGIIWVWNRGIGHWVFEELGKAGLPTLWKGQGTKWLHNDGSDKHVCVASIRSHATGKNLQHHQNQLLLQWPRSGALVEQLLGRTHRTGQQADRLVVHTCHTVEHDHEQMDSTLKDTVYDYETMGGGTRKLLLADWNPMPKQYPREFLRARGWDV